jgi:uncharacterized protein YjbJ (UPF0337 family)
MFFSNASIHAINLNGISFAFISLTIFSILYFFKEVKMEAETVKGNINELRGQIRQTWGKLTDDDISRFEGKSDELIGKVQKAYGYSKERAIHEFNNFKSQNPQYFSNKMKNRDEDMVDGEIVEHAEQYLIKAHKFGSRAIKTSAKLMRDKPEYIIMGALAVGFLTGTYMARRK